MPAHLTLVMPPGAPDPAADAALRRVLGPARALAAPARPGYEQPAALCALFDVPIAADADVPVGALGAAGDFGASGGACWLRADPVVLAPTRVELRLMAGAPGLLDAGAAGALVAALAAGGCVPGARWHLATPERWYVELAQPARVCTTPPAALAGWHVEHGLPRGPDGPAWCAHLNHAQMILHARAQDGAGAAPDITSVWFWGAGPAPDVPPARFARVYADDPVARGLAALAGAQVFAVAGFPGPDELAGATLLVPDPAQAEALFARAVRDRAAGALAGLDVVCADAQGGARVHAVAARRRWWPPWPRR